jgi:hypothetical protein
VEERSEAASLASRYGRLYDSKAVVGAAYGYQFPDREPLLAQDFSGGDATLPADLGRVALKLVFSRGGISARREAACSPAQPLRSWWKGN